MTTSFFASANPFTSTSLIIFLLSVGLLLPVVQNMTKPFYIEKPVINTDNTTTIKTLKGTI